MSDFDALLAREQHEELEKLYQGIISAIENQSGLEAVAQNIATFQKAIEELGANMLQQEGMAESLEKLFNLQNTIQAEQSNSNAELLDSLGNVIQTMITSLQKSQQAAADNMQLMQDMVKQVTTQLDKQYDMLMQKIEQDKDAEWEFHVEEVKDEIITKVRIKRIK